MIRPLVLMIGLRYTRAKNRNHFISLFSTTSMLGIILGVWALITVMSIMNGFHQDLRERILFVASHITVTDYAGPFYDWHRVEKKLSNNPTVQYQAPYVLGQGMITKGKEVTGALLRGIDPDKERHVSRVMDHIVKGNPQDLKAGSFGIVLGKYLARSLGASIGDKVTVVAPNGKITPAGLIPRMKRFTVKGIFEINMYEYDSGIALIHIDDAKKLLSLKQGVTGLRLKLHNVDNARYINREIHEQLQGQYRVRDWTQEHANFFRALEIEKRVVFIVLLLIVAVASFNIVSTLVMIVTDKRSDVAILRTLGMSPASIMKIFMVQGTTLGLVGTLLGGVLGVITAINVETLVPAIENFFNTELFPSNVYVISDFPAEMNVSDVAKIVIASLLMSFLATIYPAWRASKVQPADALRYD